MERTDARIAKPAEDQLLGAACGNHLVVDKIGRHSRQGQIAALLSNDLVTSRKRDAVGEPLNGNGVAVVHMRGDRRTHVDEF
jgi:hypothetical protein